jgi:hypothetical protein
MRILNSLKIENDIYVISNSDFNVNPYVELRIHKIRLNHLDGYEDIKNYFLQNYTHLSQNSQNFEEACFLRYFAYKLLLDQLKFKKVFLFDCDVWPTNSLSFFHSHEKSLLSPGHNSSNMISAHSSLFQSKDLISFTNFLLNEFYQNYLAFLKNFCQQLIDDKRQGGVSDMMALGIFFRDIGHESWSDANYFTVDNYYINHTFSTLPTELNVAENSWFIIILKKNYFLVATRKHRRKYATLHFQGHDKHLIPYLKYFRFIVGNYKIFALMIRLSRKFLS